MTPHETHVADDAVHDAADDPAPAPEAPADLTALLEAEGRRTLPRRWRLIGAAAAALLVVGAAAAYFGRGGADAVRYQTAPAERGDLTVTVTATGTVQPVTQVQVGIEVSGTVAEVLADYNDRVKVGQVLLRLDTAKLKAQALQSEAALKSAEAQLLQAQATVKESAANLSRLEEVRQLSGGKVPSQQDIDTAQAAVDRAHAAEGSAEAAIAEAKAALSVDDTNLAKAVVRSPVDGIVLSRSVEPGQTVAASLQAPNLFLLAESLSQMEVDVAVDEADVGQVQERQPATFTVEAYPDRTFPAVIQQVRYFPTTVQGVVTYQAVLAVHNADLSLRPGMTATAEITVAKRQGALLVPNGALRFAPKTPGAQKDDRSFVTRVLMPFRRPPRERREAPEKNDLPQKVWVLKNGAPAPVRIKTGATDGRMTEVTAGDLAPGTALLVDVLPTGKTGT